MNPGVHCAWPPLVTFRSKTRRVAPTLQGMRTLMLTTFAVSLVAAGNPSAEIARPRLADTQKPSAVTSGPIDLTAMAEASQFRLVNRQISALSERPGAVRLSEGAGPGIAWIPSSDFGEGAIEVEIRGRDVFQQSFVGVAFHRSDDTTYEAVYLRPFNFRATDPARHQHAVQYVAPPAFDWPVLREKFPEEFENPVDASVNPTGWIPLRLSITAKTVEIFVGTTSIPTLSVRRLATTNRGMIGLWVGNMSNGDFANLRLTPAR